MGPIIVVDEIEVRVPDGRGLLRIQGRFGEDPRFAQIDVNLQPGDTTITLTPEFSESSRPVAVRFSTITKSGRPGFRIPIDVRTTAGAIVESGRTNTEGLLMRLLAPGIYEVTARFPGRDVTQRVEIRERDSFVELQE